MSHLDPICLDTPAKVDAANGMREAQGREGFEWKLGDTCWYDATEINRVALGIELGKAL
jgi:hypothetical protein